MRYARYRPAYIGRLASPRVLASAARPAPRGLASIVVTAATKAGWLPLASLPGLALAASLPGPAWPRRRAVSDCLAPPNPEQCAQCHCKERIARPPEVGSAAQRSHCVSEGVSQCQPVPAHSGLRLRARPYKMLYVFPSAFNVTTKPDTASSATSRLPPGRVRVGPRPGQPAHVGNPAGRLAAWRGGIWQTCSIGSTQHAQAARSALCASAFLWADDDGLDRVL